jgi:sulfur-carrier protein
MRLLYFAWLRTKIGRAEEEIDLPPGIDTVGGLIDWLAARSPEHGAALANRALVRVAVNQDYVGPGHRLKGGDEVALFPPMTGG